MDPSGNVDMDCALNNGSGSRRSREADQKSNYEFARSRYGNPFASPIQQVRQHNPNVPALAADYLPSSKNSHRAPMPMNELHADLDKAGLAPFVGPMADAENALIYMTEGDYGNAALSGVSIVPGLDLFIKGIKRLRGVGKAADSAVGFAEGLGKSALTPNRLQHGTRHLTEEGLLPAWSGKNSPALIERALTPILEHPTATFDHTLGGQAVRGFAGEIDGTRVAVFVYKEGKYQGQLATSFVPSANQWAGWGLP